MLQGGIVIAISLLCLFVATNVAQQQKLMGPMRHMGPMGPMGPMGGMGPMGPMGGMGLMGPMGANGPMEQMSSKIKISYFNITGRAEPIRWLLAYAKVPFEDNRIAGADWPKVKPTTPLGEVPVLDLTSSDGKQQATLCQSGAILRYLAFRYDLIGMSPKQIGIADEAIESLRDIVQAILNIGFAPDTASKDEAIKTTTTDTAPRIFTFLEKRAKENGGKTVAGGYGYTYADIFVGAIWNMMGINLPTFDLTAYPNLSAIAKTIAEKDGVKAYLATRPKTGI